MAEFDPYLAAWTGILSVASTIIAYKLLHRLESRKIQRSEKKSAYSRFLTLVDDIISTLQDLHALFLIELKKPKNENEANTMFTQLLSLPTILATDNTMDILRDYIYGGQDPALENQDESKTERKRTPQSPMQAFADFFESIDTDLITEMGHIAAKQTSILGRYNNELLALNVPKTVRDAMNLTLELIRERRTSVMLAALAQIAKQPLTQDLEPWKAKWNSHYQTLRAVMEHDLKTTL